MLNLQSIEQAAQNILGVAVKTPMAKAPYLSEQYGSSVYLKKENLQVTGAFKLRGAFNRIATLDEEEKSHGIVAASAGNHAQGVAYAAKHFGIDAVIVMPESTPLTKVNGVSELGAKVLLKGSSYDEAYAYAKHLEAEQKRTFIHPFEDEAVMAGQGTVALEMLESLPELDVLIVPVGGGGLISGVACAAKSLKPEIKIVGVSACGADGLMRSFEAKKNMGPRHVRTIADGIAVRDTSDITLDLMLQYVDEMVCVDDKEIASAILLLLERQKLLVEGAGAVGVAALMHYKLKAYKGKNIGIILSGGNIDVTMLSVIIEKGLVKSHRKLKLQVTLVDKPGSLMKLTEILKETNANIVHIGYDRTSTTLAYGDAHVSIELETKGLEHQEKIGEFLTEHGYAFEMIH